MIIPLMNMREKSLRETVYRQEGLDLSIDTRLEMTYLSAVNLHQ